MNFQEIVCRLDTLLQNCRLEEAEQLLADSIDFTKFK